MEPGKPSAVPTYNIWSLKPWSKSWVYSSFSLPFTHTHTHTHSLTHSLPLKTKRRECVLYPRPAENCIETVSNTTIHCTFQEPLFTDADTAFLTARGHAVVPAPLASTAVTPHTLLYGIHLYRPLYEEALQDYLPSVYVGTDWETWEQYVASSPFPFPSPSLLFLFFFFKHPEREASPRHG